MAIYLLGQSRQLQRHKITLNIEQAQFTITLSIHVRLRTEVRTSRSWMIIATWAVRGINRFIYLFIYHIACSPQAMAGEVQTNKCEEEPQMKPNKGKAKNPWLHSTAPQSPVTPVKFRIERFVLHLWVVREYLEWLWTELVQCWW